MKSLIVFIDGPGGTGKTTLIDQLNLSSAPSLKKSTTVSVLKFPLEADANRVGEENAKQYKEDLKKRTLERPLLTGIMMLDEIVQTVRQKIVDEHYKGTQDLILLVDRGWVSTLVYQLGEAYAPMVAAFVQENLIDQLPQAIREGCLFWYRLLDPPRDQVIARKLSRIAQDDPTKLTVEFIENSLKESDLRMKVFDYMLAVMSNQKYHQFNYRRLECSQDIDNLAAHVLAHSKYMDYKSE